MYKETKRILCWLGGGNISVIRKIRRNDGRIQRYHVKHLKKFNQEYYYDKQLKSYAHKPPEYTPTEIKQLGIRQREQEKRIMFRLTLTLNISDSKKIIHAFVRRYGFRSVRLQKWSDSNVALQEEKDKLKDKMVKQVEDRIKYKKGDWWFEHTFGEELRTVPFNSSLIGKEELAFEA